ncbi:MAG: CxxC-x17-CxxC domain-containing protein [archaeon]
MGRGSGNRDNSTGNFAFKSNFSSFVEREMHKAKCAECGNECEVPFKPIEGKPVYCRDCFRKRGN